MQKKVLLGLSGDVIFAAIIIIITMTTLHTTKKRSLMVGVICDIFNVLMYVSPLTVMVRPPLQSHTFKTWVYLVNYPHFVFFECLIYIYIYIYIYWQIFCVSFSYILWQKQVITTKSVEYMPFYLSLTNFLNGSIWTAYALIQFDIYVLVISISAT